MALTVGEIEGVIGVDDSKVDSGLDRTESKFKSFAKKAAVIGAAAGTALGVGISEAMDVEKGNDKLAAQLGLTAKESERIGGVAGRLYAGAYGESIGEVNDAVGAVISSIKGMRNASTREVEAMSAKVLDLAAAFEIDTARAAQVAGQMITSGIAKNGSQAMDLLTASMQRVPAAVREDLIDAVDEYGPFMQSIGLKGQQAMSLLVKGAEKGMFGLDKTGDALKEFTIRATDMSTASKEGFDILGMSQEKMAGKLLAGGDTAKRAFNKIINGLRGIKDPTKQSTAALALFGTPLEDLNVSEIPKFLDSLSAAEGSLGKVRGATARMGQTLNDNASTNLTSFWRQAKMAFVNVVGGMVLPIVNQAASILATMFGPALDLLGSILTSTVIPALQTFGQFIADNQTPITIIAGLIAAVFIPHLVALGVASTVAKTKVVAAWLAKRVAAVRAAAVHSGAVLKMVAGWALMGARSLLGAAKVAAAWLIAMGPIGIVIAAVVGLVALIIAKWDTIKRVTVRVWNAVWSFIQGAVRKVLAAVGWIGSLPGKVAAWFGRVKDAAVQKALALVAWLRGLPGRILSALGNLGRLLFSAGADVLRGLWNGIVSMAGFVKDQIIGLVSNIIPGPIKDILGISSPSRLTFGYGVNVGQGLALGIDSQTAAVARASARLARSAATPIQKAKAEMLKHLRGGGTLFEDFSFRGDSALASRLNDRIANQFRATGREFNRRSVERFLAEGANRGGDPVYVTVELDGAPVAARVRAEQRQHNRMLRRRAAMAGATA